LLKIWTWQGQDMGLNAIECASLATLKHIDTKLFPVTAPNPELSGKKLKCPDLGIATSAHLATDVVSQDAVKRVAARVPEDHARRILLDMPEVTTGSEATVIEVVYGVLS
jgi:hypothetical protein